MTSLAYVRVVFEDQVTLLARRERLGEAGFVERVHAGDAVARAQIEKRAIDLVQAMSRMPEQVWGRC